MLPDHNEGLSSSDALGRLLEDDIVIIGADVCHPGASRGKRPLPSLVGVVASFDGKMATWKAALRAQPPREEIISDMQNIISELFKGLTKVRINLLND